MEATIERPTIAESSGARIETWGAWRSAGDDAEFIAGCVATPIPGWVEDMRPVVEGRTVSLAAASAAKIAGRPLDARGEDGGMLALRGASDLGGPILGRARTFVGFDTSQVFTCFAACAAKELRVPNGALECQGSVATATLEGSLGPPPAGLLLDAGTWAIHHPRPVVSIGGVLVVVVGWLAIVLRWRPRSKSGVR